jgi:hypothetical protein
VQTSDWIAACAALIATVAAIYSKQARDAARHANQINLYNALRQDRLAVFMAVDQFCLYCSQYITMQAVGLAKGSRQLVERIDTFKDEVARRGPLGMPDVEALCEELNKRAWRIQRLVDRIAGGQQTPHDAGYATADENLEALVEWFAGERTHLHAMMSPYLNAPK